VTILKKIPVVFGMATLIAFSFEENATFANIIPQPLFNDVASYTTKVSTNNDLADIYYPNPTNLKTHKYSFPIALFLQGSSVDKSNYSNFAIQIARYGFIVVVPNRKRTIPPIGPGLPSGTGLFAETSQIKDVLAFMKSENDKATSPVVGVVNTKKLALLGHSFGGIVGLSAVGNLCIFPVCLDSFNRPKELAAVAFYGTGILDPTTRTPIPINNSRIPVALLAGSVDSVVPPVISETTYDNIQDPPKILINILGANHYSITNTNNVPNQEPDSNMPIINQDVAVKTIARWTGLFLRASVLNDKDAFNYLYCTGDALDPNVSITKSESVKKFRRYWASPCPKR
jgi:dienelactone hydrolase